MQTRLKNQIMSISQTSEKELIYCVWRIPAYARSPPDHGGSECSSQNGNESDTTDYCVHATVKQHQRARSAEERLS